MISLAIYAIAIITFSTASHLLPHGQCWMWDWKLILLHNFSDLLTFSVYMLIPAAVLYIYKRGRLSSLANSFPRLWILGAGFILLCGVSHFGNILEVWFGGWLYYVTGINKLLMGITSALFWRVLVSRMDDIVMLGRAMNKITHDNPELSKHDKSDNSDSNSTPSLRGL